MNDTEVQRMPTTTASRVNRPDARELLLSKRSEVLSRLNGHEASWEQLGRVAEDDQATISHEEFVSLEMNRISYSQFKLVEDALARLESGEYGTCLRCECQISPKRLIAVPWASHCIVCEEALSQELEMEQSQERVA
jgi:DnaK suppressor protein